MAPTIDGRDRRKKIRRTAILCMIVALAFYLGFILMGVLRSR